jgi:hypothetical protein
MFGQNKNKVKARNIPFDYNMTVVFILGIVLIAVSAGVFFGYCKPFDGKKWISYKCIVQNKEWFEIDRETVRVVYFVDGVRYENTLRYEGGESGRSTVLFLYNEDNPNEIAPSDRKSLMIFMPIVACFGITMILIVITQYRKMRKTKSKI